ncbi:MAG: T9SS type A sorting domain-containing protein [Bacteroidota bacterium]
MKKSILFVLLTSVICIGQAQTNLGFEQWTNAGTYEEPNGWQTANALTMFGSPVSCIKNNRAHYGNYSVLLLSTDFRLLGDSMPIPGIMVQQAPYSQRPKSVSIYYQNLSPANDSAFLIVNFFKGPTDDDNNMIGDAEVMLTRQRNWTLAKTDITWLNGQSPDTVLIAIQGTGYKKDSLIVDDLSFSSWGTDISAVAAEKAPVLYKNNAGLLAIKNYTITPDSKIIIRNLLGEIVFETVVTEEFIQFKPANSGIYVYEISDKTQHFTGKLVF